MKIAFDIHHDNELIEADTHFWCEGCMIAKPLDDKSPDNRHCQGCHGVLEAIKAGEAEKPPVITYPAIQPQSPKKAARDKALIATKTSPVAQKRVAKLPTKGIVLGIKEKRIIQHRKRVIMQHPVGRPKKAGEVHRVTEWRREKAKQGVLL